MGALFDCSQSFGVVNSSSSQFQLIHSFLCHFVQVLLQNNNVAKVQSYDGTI